MKKRQRDMLRELQSLCNQMGASLDGTSTCTQKYIDRQKALIHVSNVVYAVLTDHPENDSTEDDYEIAKNSLEHLKGLSTKIYPDKNGNYSISNPK